jgi:putative oxidoreductase
LINPYPFVNHRLATNGASAMERFRRTARWLEANRALAYPVIRVYIGLALFVRGWVFIADSEAAVRLVSPSGSDWLVSLAVIHYVALAHLVGGLMLAAGLFTRVAAAVQLPILIGATFFIHLSQGLVQPDQSFELSALVLFLLLVFLAFGSGPWSVDEYLERGSREQEERISAMT